MQAPEIMQAEYVEGSRAEWKEGMDPRAYIYGVWRIDRLDANRVNFLEIEASTPASHGVVPEANVSGFITETKQDGREAIMGNCYITTLQVVPKINRVRFRFTCQYWAGTIFVRPMIVVGR